MRVMVTGANGFVGKNLLVHLTTRDDVDVRTFTRADGREELTAGVAWAEVIVHLAGANRPPSEDAFTSDNTQLAEQLADAVRAAGPGRHVIYTSSIHVDRPSPYGESKRAAEDHLAALAAERLAKVSILRLPNIFGKWARPHYNSAVATFCAAVAGGGVPTVHDRTSELRLLYIDDLCSALVTLMGEPATPALNRPSVGPEYRTTVGEVADIIQGFAASRISLQIERVGTGLMRALYATYLTYLPPESFAYDVPAYSDPRGMFVEVLKTFDSGQFSFFTSGPGIVRGQHYHHTKTEKFLVVRGSALFRSRHMLTGEQHEIETFAEHPRVVETIPGWAHDVVNTSDRELIVLVWANEVFDRERADTTACKVGD